MDAAVDLTVVTATLHRPCRLLSVLEQFRAQSFRGFTAEHVVVSDGPDDEARALCGQFGVRYFEAPPGGLWGAACKDLGIHEACGEYVAFWDDDNHYFPHALATLYAAAHGTDIGVVQAIHRAPLKRYGGRAGVPIPESWSGNFVFGEVDTMCVCVARAVAAQALWAAHTSRGTDYHWLSKLVAMGAETRYVPVVIGWKL